jgi:hypothetical protein
VARAVQWLPVGDNHHVVASLRLGGELQLFISQETLMRLNATAAATGDDRVIGLLVGSRYECPLSHIDYAIVDALGEKSYALAPDEEPLQQLTVARDAFSGKSSRRILGWYFISGEPADRALHQVEGTHKAAFGNGSEVVLTLTSRHQDRSGVFFRYDESVRRCYRIPFLELIDPHVALDRRHKSTCLAWPGYLATEETVPVEGLAPPASIPHRVASSFGHAASAVPAVDTGDRRGWKVLQRFTPSTVANELAPATRGPAPLDRPTGGATVSAEPPSTARDVARGYTQGLRGSGNHRHSPNHPTPTSVDDVPIRTEMPRNPTPKPRSAAESPSRTVEEAERSPDLKPARRPRTLEDTSVGDDVSRYVKVAESDGFFVVATFDAVADLGGQSIRVLHDPYCGLLLVVYNDRGTVFDAVLHYNLHVDDPAIVEATFSEHRDVASQTVYGRESTAEGLLERSRRLRETQRLVPEWKVTPSIYFVAPGEWDALAGRDPVAGAQAIRALNRRRIEALPEAITARYKLAAR